MQSNVKIVLSVFLLLSTEGKRPPYYLGCERGVCLTMSEYQTDFAFDQPSVMRLEGGEGGILSRLEKMERLNVTFASAATAEEETNLQPVARLIHLIWLGSPLAGQFEAGIRSFVTLNPGESSAITGYGWASAKDIFKNIRFCYGWIIRRVAAIFPTSSQSLSRMSTNNTLIQGIS